MRVVAPCGILPLFIKVACNQIPAEAARTNCDPCRTTAAAPALCDYARGRDTRLPQPSGGLRNGCVHFWRVRARLPNMQAAQAHATYIETSGKRPVVAGSDIKVSQIASEYEHLSMTPDEIVEAHPHLTLAQVHAALAYFYDHQEAIRAEWDEGQRLVAELQAQYPPRHSSR